MRAGRTEMSETALSIKAIEVEHAWRYFEIHSKQRMTLFNYFVAIAGLIIASVGASAQANYLFVSGSLGILLILVSWIFWKLDQRMSFLVKNAEEKYCLIESSDLKSAMIFTEEPSKFYEVNKYKGYFGSQWTVGRSFRALFLLMAAVGIITAIFSVFRIFEFVPNDEFNELQIIHVRYVYIT